MQRPRTNPRELAGWGHDWPAHGITDALITSRGFVRVVVGAGTTALAKPGEQATHVVTRRINANSVDLIAAPGMFAAAAGSAPHAEAPGALLYPHATIDGDWQTAANGAAFGRVMSGGDVQLLVPHVEASSARNALVYPVGNFTALAVNDSGAGADGAVYKLPVVDALQLTLPNKADMNAAEGIYRVRISGDWAALSTQATVLSFIDDTANGVDMGTGLPDDGNEWLDMVFDAANDKWIATSGGDVTLTQVVPTYTLHTEVPANIRLYLIDGTGASAEGLYRKETVGDAPNHIG